MTGRGRLWLASMMGVVGALAFPVAFEAYPGGPPAWLVASRGLSILPYGAWLFVQVQPRRRGFAPVFASGLAFYALLLFWLDVAMERFGGMPAWQAWPALAALVALCALLQAGVLPLVAILARSYPRLPAPLIFAVAWNVCEQGRGAVTHFPWGQWGYTQAGNLPLAQWAARCGTSGVGFLLALFAAGLGQLVTWPRAAARRPECTPMLPAGGRMPAGCWHSLSTRDSRIWATALWLVAFAAMWGLGEAWLQAPVERGGALRVGVVQPSTPQEVKNSPGGRRRAMLATLDALSRDAVRRGAQLMLWPESAWPGFLPADTAALPAKPLGAPAVIGVSLYEEAPDAPGAAVLSNSALCLDADMRVCGRYDKQVLVPFGEYVPLPRWLPLHKLVPTLADFRAGGPGQPPLCPPITAAAKGLWTPPRLGMLICYDGVFAAPARRLVRAGATLLVNLTNDAWYGATSAPYQHRDFYVMRAIETGRWVVRAANSGLTVAIDPHGRQVAGPRLNEVAAATFDVQALAGATATAYVTYGEVVLRLSQLLALAAVLKHFLARPRLAC